MIIGRKTAESIARSKEKWSKSFSKNVAKKQSGRNKIYRLPNGLYVWRKRKKNNSLAGKIAGPSNKYIGYTFHKKRGAGYVTFPTKSAARKKGYKIR